MLEEEIVSLVAENPATSTHLRLVNILVERRSLPWGSDGLSCSRCLAFQVVTHSSTNDTLPDSISTCSVPSVRLVNTLR